MKVLREKAGLNRQQMAKALGIAARTWQRWESEGGLPVRVEVVLKIAALSGTPIEEALELMGFKIPSRADLVQKLQS